MEEYGIGKWVVEPAGVDADESTYQRTDCG